jgi:bifunctional DNase/RNase
LAVRARVPILVHDAVMGKAAIVPESEMEAEGGEAAEGSDRLSAFSDFVDSLDFEDLDKGKKDDDDE